MKHYEEWKRRLYLQRQKKLWKLGIFGKIFKMFNQPYTTYTNVFSQIALKVLDYAKLRSDPMVESIKSKTRWQRDN